MLAELGTGYRVVYQPLSDVQIPERFTEARLLRTRAQGGRALSFADRWPCPG